MMMSSLVNKKINDIVGDSKKNESDNEEPKMKINLDEIEMKQVVETKMNTKIASKKRVKKVTTADAYINTEKRKLLAIEVQKKARAYKINFNRVEVICESNMELAGSMTQVQNACVKLSNNTSTAGCFREALEAGESLLELEAAKRSLEADGVPVLVSLEITRRILDEDLGKKSIPIQIPVARQYRC